MSAHSYNLPDAIVYFDRDEHSYFARVEFKHGRGTREVCRGSLDRVLDRIAAWRRHGLPLGPYHVPERAYQWTYYEHDGSHRATTPLGEARILPYIGDLFLLVLVPDYAVCVLFESHDVEELKRLAYDHTATPRLAISLSGVRYEFSASGRTGEIAHVTVHGVRYVVVPHVDERGLACVAVDAELPGSSITPRLTVHPVEDLEHLDVLWSDGDEVPRVVWPKPRPNSTRTTDAPSTRPKASERGPETRDTVARTLEARTPPAGVDPLVWEGFVLQAEHTATLTFDARLGRPLYVASMRAQCSEALIAAARAGTNIRGTGIMVRRQLEDRAGTRLQGSQSAFKEWMRVLMTHTGLGRQAGRYLRELPLADLRVKDSTYSKEMRAHALAARDGARSAPNPSARTSSLDDLAAGAPDLNDGAPAPSSDPIGDRPRSVPEPGPVHAVLVMNGDRLVASRFGVPADDAQVVVRELRATAGPHTHVTLDGRNVWLEHPFGTATTPETSGHEGDKARSRPDHVGESSPASSADPRVDAPGSESRKAGTAPASPAASGESARAPQSAGRAVPSPVRSPAHRSAGQHPPPEATRHLGDREQPPGFRPRDGPPGRRTPFREADLNEDLSNDDWIDE